ncbi:hypothetical protein BGZ61DRAFT_541163 [Ilyonectria robusta]|uniref:uncharacterized protein n=1 Tax=Ilyonectria robusta TaxID=1079257 RepID=UPI001E8DC879|nr:uncharacterized protein BGZ61DRAFT_541163 [Ilyonectria robusta]KAH8654897.1 hypothetical protein BGZ61DRAFT_541163 [Ilyonectria robusta]
MPREESVRVSTDEIRRTLEALDRRRIQNSARETQRTFPSNVPNSSTSQTAGQRRQELVRVPHEEILRMLQHLDRQHAEDRARQRTEEAEQIRRPTTPNPLYRLPQTLSSPKRPRAQEALPTPPATQQNRSPKRPGEIS